MLARKISESLYGSLNRRKRFLTRKNCKAAPEGRAVFLVGSDHTLMLPITRLSHRIEPLKVGFGSLHVVLLDLQRS